MIDADLRREKLMITDIRIQLIIMLGVEVSYDSFLPRLKCIASLRRSKDLKK